MKQLIFFLIAATALSLFGCSGATSGNMPRAAAQLDPIYGSTLDGVSMLADAGLVRLSFKQIPGRGQFVRLQLPAELHPGAESWEGDDGVLHLVAPIAGGAEIGIVPAATYDGHPVKLLLKLAAAQRQVSTPPSGVRNVIADLSVSDIGNGNVGLDWTQVNVGDYDFNGEVNISDLTPLAARLGATYDRQAAGAELTTPYWVDGDANGEVNIADVTPIGANYHAQVVGYNVKHNGTTIPGAGAGEPTVAIAQAQKRNLLPPLYHVLASGLTIDTWVVASVDAAGVEGADSAGNLGPVQVIANVSLAGADFFDFATGANPGPFGPSKMSSRIIDPSEIVNRASIGSASPAGTTVSFSNLPSGRTLMVDIRYRPAVNLATGAPRIGSGLKSASASDDEVVTSVIFPLPAGTSDPSQINTDIQLLPNPSGGYFVDLTAMLTIPAGDNPDTLALEDGFTETQHTRLAFADGRLFRDTNLDGQFDDEAGLEDIDHDCVSESQIDLQEFDDDHSNDEEYSIEGALSSFDEAAGSIVLTGAVVDDGDFEAPPDPVTVQFDERTRFELRHRTDANPDGDPFDPIDPSTLQPGDKVEVYLRLLTDSGQKYWGWEIKKVVDDRT